MRETSRHLFAQRLALAALIIAATFHVDEVMKASGGSGFLPIADRVARTLILEVPVTILSAFSLIITWYRPSFLVSLALLIAGILITVDEITIGTQYLSVLTLPAPVIGLLLGIVILALGTAKILQFASAMKTPTANRNVDIK